MKTLGDIFGDINGRGVEILRSIASEGLSADDVARVMGRSRREAGRILTASRAMTARLDGEEREHRDAAFEAAASLKLSADAIAVINVQLNQLAKDVDYSRELLRLEITRSCEGLSVDEIKALAAQRIRSLNRTSVITPRPRCNISGEDAHGMVYLNGYLKAATARPFLDKLNDRAERAYNRDDDWTHSQRRGEALEELLVSPEATSDALGVHVVLRADELSGTERENISLTDGTVVGKLIDEKLGHHGWAVVYSEETNLPERAYRIARTANTKQRAMLAGDQVLCAAGDCKIPAKRCQAHHLIPWSQGGETNVDNLVLLCPHHHSLITRNKATIERLADGTYLWTSTTTGIVSKNRHVAAAGSGARLALRC